MTHTLGPVSATLSDLVRDGVGGSIVGDASTRVTGVRHDSRSVARGDLFAAVPGGTHDGARFVVDAVARGASAVMVGSAVDGLSVPQLVVPDVRRGLAFAAAAVYGHPTFALDVVGVTGTNGKTTVTWLVEHALVTTGHPSTLIGTVALHLPGVTRDATHTTPEGDDLARIARESVERGATHLVMEVSSHALALHRADAVRFRVAAFTNLTQDHLDFHGTMDAYFDAKARLFRELAPGAAVVCVDDAWGERLAAETAGKTRLLRVSRRPDGGAEVRALDFAQDRGGITARLATPAGELVLRSPLLGAHNLENLLVATGIGLALDVPPATWMDALATAQGAPGRLERVPCEGDVAIFVDYAHTPDAVARALAALRPVTRGRLFAVLGCGGDRDRGKRPLMGAAAARGADVVVVTSDNPRTEAPESIVAEILPGLTGSPELAESALAGAARGHVVLVDRRAAIAAAIGAAAPGDTVLIAGKGHEPYQIVGTTKHPFDDREEARRAVAARGAVA